MFPHTVTPNSINLLIDGRMRTVDKSHMNHGMLLTALKAGDWEAVRNLCDIPTFIAKVTEGRVQANENGVMFDGRPAHGAIVTRIMGLIKQGMPVNAYAKFMDRLMNNPLESAREELFIWLESNNMPITPDGYLLAFKKVNENYKSYHDGVTDNSIGTKLPRMENVDPDRNNTCSRGYHFCSYEYLPHYMGGSGRVVIVKIDPADVAAIPNDYNNAKGRAYTYEIMGEVPEDEASKVFAASTVYDGYSEWPVDSDNVDDLSQGTPDEDPFDDDYYHYDEDIYDENRDALGGPAGHEAAPAADVAAADELIRIEEQARIEAEADANPETEDDELVFEHNGKSYDAYYVATKVDQHGQRGFERLTGVPRTTLQGWLDKIEDLS